MLKINGLNIKELPFEGLEVLQEIISFEGVPILVHYKDIWNDDIVSYLVDFDKTGYRRLYAKISKEELFNYLIGIKSLKALFSEIISDFLFLVDFDPEETLLSCILISKYLNPENYFPIENSFFKDGLNNFYLEYLRQVYYYYRLKENSFIINVKPTNEIHGKTVGAKEAAFVLANTTNSVEGYIRAKAFKILKDDFGDASKINRRITTTKNALSPRIADAAFGSFEVWLSIDTLIFHGEDKYDTKIREGLLEGYKQDVLDVDFTSVEDAKIISEKYTEDERKMIFEPILKLVNNNDFTLSISDTKNIIKRNNKSIKSSNLFWDTLLPAPTLEQLVEEQQRKSKIVSIVLNLKEGENISKLNKRDLQSNLLFSQENAEVPYEVESPLVFGERQILLKKPIRCLLKVDENDHLQLYSQSLDLYEEGSDFNKIVESIKKQFVYLVDSIKEIEEKDFLKAEEIRSYLQ